MNLLDATTRVALSAYLHDLGKLAERANIDHEGRLDAHKNLYCPWQYNGGYHSHIHAAYTGIAWDELEATGHFPDLRGNCPPFVSIETDANLPDSVVNAAAAHHKPDTFLQWVVATADRVASGFERDEFDSQYNSARERENHYRARLLTLFEQIDKREIEEGKLNWRYPLELLSPQFLFPRTDCTPSDDATARAQYHQLWEALLDDLKRIPRSHRDNLPLWLDHFDTLWLAICHAIPAATAFGVKPEVSLYDHSKATAALAAALWRWHHELDKQTVADLKDGWEKEKFLLIQGDFFGIQNFIFAEGGETNKHAHKLLRGRSFQVALLAECAALTLLDMLALPPTSQIINAAGKFLIVAPNTAKTREAVENVQRTFNHWCLEHTYGEIGIGLAVTPASCNDFAQKRFSDLVKRLFEALDIAKHQRFNLCGANSPAVFSDFLDRFNNELGVCEINGRYPAESKAPDYAISHLTRDQIRIGESLTKCARVLISRDADSLQQKSLALDYFGWRIAFVHDAEESGNYGQLAKERKLIRCWDFSLPEKNGKVFHGLARRFVNTYVPRFNQTDVDTQDKYECLQKEDEFGLDSIKTLHHLACEDRQLKESDRWRGEIALVTLKGDVDNLGTLFQKGLEKPTFAKWASLSRQINLFFALWLPWFCEHGKDSKDIARYRNTYTVFAGGDDFFLIGPWRSTIALAGEMQKHFERYTTNPGITFSAGLSMTQPKVPARHLARSTEAALERSKAYQDKADKPKNAATLWNQTVSWQNWHALLTERADKLEALLAEAESHGAKLSTGYLYDLLQLADKAERARLGRNPEDSLWRAQLVYRTTRFIGDRMKSNGDAHTNNRRRQLLEAINQEFTKALDHHHGAYRLPLSILLYGRRE
ncbi:type III-A CRISPR-associated protein Cas10/Csm1 [Nitrosomonas sp. Nm132]|uniref:type III-A CRISPR-associated protein Cas10/Csm1 n=1 Tax=Nitrosomonas sp. Nm132 TaxID=1881053 RepID=UPI00088FEF14|nr:type III-A CRISPR-associated protein Cas10/Csm1 [Nitrosomonas sp. Nm132]SDH35721.1 CRISPR-associated protein Csm1 [Nitrosomonas sp. Nm132]